MAVEIFSITGRGTMQQVVLREDRSSRRYLRGGGPERHSDKYRYRAGDVSKDAATTVAGENEKRLKGYTKAGYRERMVIARPGPIKPTQSWNTGLHP